MNHNRNRTHGPINVHKSFDGRSTRLYDVVARRLMRRVYRRLAEDIALVARPDAAVLDIGTGPGILITEIARLRPDLRITGVDLSADMVRVAQRNSADFADRVTAQEADAADLPFAEGTFDIVVTSFSLHHWGDVDAAGGEITRVLRSGGQLFVYDFPRAPFDDLDAAMREGKAGPARRTEIRTGRMHLKSCIRQVLSV